MRIIIMLLSISILISCRDTDNPIVSPNGVSIASSESELISILKKSPNLKQISDDNSFGITGINFLEGKKDVYAIVSYHLKDGIKRDNIVLHKSLENEIFNVYTCGSSACHECSVNGESDGEGGHIMTCAGCKQACRWEIELP